MALNLQRIAALKPWAVFLQSLWNAFFIQACFDLSAVQVFSPASFATAIATGS